MRFLIDLWFTNSQILVKYREGTLETDLSLKAVSIKNDSIII